MRIEKFSAETLKVASMRNSVRFYGPGPQPCESWQVATVGLQTQRPCGWRMSFRGNCAAPRGNPNIRKLLLERYRRFESQSLRHPVRTAERSGCITARIADPQPGFRDCIRRMQSDCKPMMRRKLLDFVSVSESAFPNERRRGWYAQEGLANS
jgi:hypothetical protein